MLTAIVLASLLAAPGDAVYVQAGAKIVQKVGLEPGVAIVLSGAEKLELASALASTFPGINPASMDRYYCFASPSEIKNRGALNLSELSASLQWRCDAHDGNPAATDADALDYEIATNGACTIHDRADGSSFLACTRPLMGSDGRILHDAFTESIFDQTLNLVWEFLCKRSPAEPTEISCTHNPVKIAPPAAWRTDRKAGLVALTLGRVAQ